MMNRGTDPHGEEIIRCTRCPRLVEWRSHIARVKVRRHRDEIYWGRPVPSFGPLNARLLVVGLAPAAHGANRTGRMFTGDRSGEWLYRALHETGFASQAVSLSRSDGMRLADCRITAVAHCAPPANRLTGAEIRSCADFLSREIELMKPLRVVLALGSVAYRQVIRIAGQPGKRSKIRFGHGVRCALSGHRVLLASFHPSQQNTFTGRLTRNMFDDILRRARLILEQYSDDQ